VSDPTPTKEGGGKILDVITPSGNKGRIREEDFREFALAGGKVDTKATEERKTLHAEAESQRRQNRLEDKYGALGSTLAGVIESPIAAVASNAIPGLGPAALHGARKAIDYSVGVDPTSMQAAFRTGQEAGFGGIVAPLEIKAIEAFAGKEAADQYRKTYKLNKEHNPASHIGGEASGFIMGGHVAAEMAGLGGLAKVASKAIPSAALESAGHGASHMAASGLAKLGIKEGVGGAVRQAVTKGLLMAPGTAVEGAVLNAAHQLSEDVIDDKEITGEKLWMAAKTGAFVGGGVGFGLGAAGSLVKSFASSRAMRDASYEQSWRSLDPLKKYTKEADQRLSGGARGVGDLGLQPGTKGVGQTMQKYGARTEEEIAAALHEKVLPALKEEIAKHGGAKIGVDELRQNISKAIDPIRESGVHSNIVASIDDQVNAMIEKMRPTFDKAGKGTVDAIEVIKQRRFLDDIVFKEVKSLDPNQRVAYLREISSKMEGTALDAIEAAAKASGDPAAKQIIGVLKHDAHALSIAERAAQDTTSRMATNRNFSLSDYQSMIGGAVMGGGGATSLVTGAIGGAINKLGRAHGNDMMARLLSKAADMSDLIAAKLHIDKQVQKAAKGIAGDTVQINARHIANHAAHAPDVRPSAPLSARYANAVKEVHEMRDNLPRLVTQTSAPNTPKVAQQYLNAEMRVVNYLSNAQPKANTPFGAVVTDDIKPGVPQYEMAKFVRQVEVAKDPTKALSRFASGKVSREDVEVLKVAAPKVYEEVHAKVTEHLAKKGKTLDFATRQRMWIMFDAPSDPSHDPSVAKALQANVAINQDDNGGGKPSKPLNMKTESTGMDRIGS
jgi:hypothetical protein